MKKPGKRKSWSTTGTRRQPPPTQSPLFKAKLRWSNVTLEWRAVGPSCLLQLQTNAHTAREAKANVGLIFPCDQENTETFPFSLCVFGRAYHYNYSYYTCPLLSVRQFLLFTINNHTSRHHITDAFPKDISNRVASIVCRHLDDVKFQKGKRKQLSTPSKKKIKIK